MKLLNDTLKLSKAQLLKRLSRASQIDQPIGTVTMEHLPPRFFGLLVKHHNLKVDWYLEHVSTENHDLRAKIESLRIPSYAQFQRILDDSDKRKSVPPELRKPGDYFTYRKWVLSVAPLSTWFQNFVKKPFEYYLPFQARRKHMYLVGASGSGKSEAIKSMILSDKTPRKGETTPVSNRVAILVMEPHGDLSEQIAKQQVFYDDFQAALKEGREPNLLFIDPLLGYGEGKFPILNPFQTTTRCEIALGKQAQQLCSAILSMLGSGKELSLTMETLLIPCLVLLLKLEGTTFHDFLRLMNDDPALVEQGKRSANKTHREFFHHRFLESSYKRTKSSLRVPS